MAPHQLPGGEPLSFRINSPGGPLADEAFNNNKHFFKSETPLTSPFGLEKYEIGPQDARMDYYRKVESGNTRLYFCYFVGDHSQRHGLCEPVGDRLVIVCQQVQ